MSDRSMTRLPSFVASLVFAVPALAIEPVEVTRVDDQHVRVTWVDLDPATIFVVDRPVPPGAAVKPASVAAGDGVAVIVLPRDQRRYLALRDGGDGSFAVAAERVVPLEHGSNFRDLGGYRGAGGQHVAWGRIFRSGAQPMLTDGDLRLLDGLGLKTIIDLRSLEERSVAPDQLDDRTGALFLSNDYSIKTLLAELDRGAGGARYAGTEQKLAPQFRALFTRLLADDGATMYHCSAGQDRRGWTLRSIPAIRSSPIMPPHRRARADPRSNPFIRATARRT